MVFFFFVFFLACTALALLNVYPGDVHQNTAEIYMWSTLGFELIYSRHPPLLPWIVGALNDLVPVNYVVLAAFNVTLAAYAVWRIARITVGEARAVLVVAIYWLSPYTVWHAVKFDHNAILLSTWLVGDMLTDKKLDQIIDTVGHKSATCLLLLGRLISALNSRCKYL